MPESECYGSKLPFVALCGHEARASQIQLPILKSIGHGNSLFFSEAEINLFLELLEELIYLFEITCTSSAVLSDCN